MARALTGDELIKLRRDGQRARLYLAVHTPASVFTARLNGVPSSDDKVATITYDGGSAGYASCIAGQTVYVGSSAGAYDRGMARLRGTLSAVSGTMKIGETSEITWTDNDYLTVVDEFGLWPRHLRLSSSVTYMDYEVVYSNQHASCDPVPVLGPPAVAWLTGATVNVAFDASDSWVIGSSLSSYSWSAPGSSATSGTATATPTITYNAAGTYRVSCTITAANGKSFTGYRTVFVFTTAAQPATVFQLNSCSGEWQTGGWSFRVTMYDEALRTEIRDRAMVVLFARDFYGADEASIGPVAGRENVIAVGWVDGESIVWSPEQGTVTFDAQGPHWWMQRMAAFPCGIEDSASTPAAWTEFGDLTPARGMWHLLHWRTTATLMMDVLLTSDTREISVFDAPMGQIWQQLTQQAEGALLAHPACDRYGRLYVEIDTQVVPAASRSGYPVVHTLATQDWRDQIAIQRQPVPDVALVDLSGVFYSAGTGTPLFSLSPGHVPAHHGAIQRHERLALSGQSQANTLAGMIVGRLRNEYPVVSVSLASNHRGFDICPHQFATISIGASDTERGVTWSAVHLIPRRVSFQHDAGAGTLLADVEFERETFAFGAITGDPPATPPDPGDPPPPPVPTDPVPTVPETWQFVVAVADLQMGRTFNFADSSPNWEGITAGLPATGLILGLDIGPDGQAWCVVSDAGDYDTSGLYHCSDILAVSVSWALIMSCAVAAALTGGGSPQLFYSVVVDASSEAWVVMTDAGAPGYRTCVFHGTPATIATSKVQQTPAVCPWFDQFCMSRIDEDVFASAGNVYYGSSGRVLNLRLNTAVTTTLGVQARQCYQLGGSFVAADDGSAYYDVFDHTVNLTDVVYAPANAPPTLTVSEGPAGTCMFYENGWLRLNADRIVQPGTVFGSGLTAGAMCFGESDSELLWVCSSALDVRSIAHSGDGGATWDTKDGDWVSEIGAWAGGGNGHRPFIVHKVF